MQRLADVREVGEGRLLGADAQHLRRTHHELGLAAGRHVRILVQNDLEDARQQLIVRVVAVQAEPRLAGVLNCCGWRWAGISIETERDRKDNKPASGVCASARGRTNEWSGG